MATNDAQRRSYGTGALFEKVDSAGRVSSYGKWRHNGTQVKRRIGPKRSEGSRDGLTRRKAEAELHRLIAEARPIVPTSGALTIGKGVGLKSIRNPLGTLSAESPARGSRCRPCPLTTASAIWSSTNSTCSSGVCRLEHTRRSTAPCIGRPR
jgi:hypothetical protein